MVISMKMFFKLLIGCSVAFVIIVSYLFFLTATSPLYAISKNEQLILQVERQAVKKLSAKYKMDCIGTGGGNKDGQVRMSSLSFIKPKPLDKEEARRLIVACTQEYLQMINDNEELRPALLHYPFTERDVELTIFSTYPDGHDVYHPIIGVVSSEHGKISYQTNDPDKKHAYKLDEEEPFAEALKILALEKVLAVPSE